ncbi:MAG: fibrobacter succinogenes major paralogous domain-containing protein, partial [Bacteroidales bacterium]|nr:fibrobacter succinogenes major paralogous domain-containing protein [Bacteroidales bacterium]
TDGSGPGAYVSAITGLDPNTTYFVRAYATNEDGPSYGEERSFKTWSGTVIDFDGNVYYTVRIGEQNWMAENLKVTHFDDGTALLLVEDNAAWATGGNGDKTYCWYENNSESGEIFGALYPWHTAMNSAASSGKNPSGIQGICPDAWHIPSDEEWKQLETFLGMSLADVENPDWRGANEGGMLKQEGTTHWNDPNSEATNSTGFSALPGGLRNYEGVFSTAGEYSHFWTATGYDNSNAWVRNLGYDRSGVGRFYVKKDNGSSVRCVEGQGYSVPVLTTRAVTNISGSTAESGGEITDDGGNAITTRGVCWSTSQEPTLSDNVTTDGAGTGNFTSEITDLIPGTLYYVRAYATNT